MEESRKPMIPMEISEAVARYRSKYKCGEEVFTLVIEDLQYGLTKGEVEKYLRNDRSVSQMRVISKCIRNGYSEEVLGIIAKDGLSGQQMAVAYEFYEKGIPLEQIQEVMDLEKSPYSMKVAYQKIWEKVARIQPEQGQESEYVEELLEQIKNVVSKIEFQEKRYDALNEKLTIFESTKQEEEIRNGLLMSLEEKDLLISNQQDLLNQANGTVARLRNDLEGKEKELAAMKTKWEEQELESKNREAFEVPYKQEEVDPIVATADPSFREKGDASNGEKVTRTTDSSATIPLVYGIPAIYQATFVDGSGKVVHTPPVEVEEKKSSGMISLLSRIGIKKKSRQDIVKLVAGKELSTEQLVQIRNAMEKGLTENQLVRLIHSKMSAAHMKEIIEIAVLENNLED